MGAKQRKPGKKVSLQIATVILFLTSPLVMAAGGLSVHHGQSGHHAHLKHHGIQASVGNVQIRSHARRSYSYGRNYKRRGHYYAYPRNYYRSTPSYSSFYSPAQRYHSRQNEHSYYRQHSNSYNSQYSSRRNDSQSNHYSGNAWSSLARGQTHQALKQFADEAQAHPKAGIPKLGFSISSALNDRPRESVYAMRRAFRIDPHNLHHYRLQSDVQPHIRSLIGKYQYDLQHRGRVQDEAFMLAALSYLNR